MRWSFNYLIGNNDAHGKNFSFLYHDDGARLAPLYDLVCTRAYPDLADEMAMKIGGERKPHRLTMKHWERFFQEAGLAASAASGRMKALLARVRKEIDANTDPAMNRIIRSNLNRLNKG